MIDNDQGKRLLAAAWGHWRAADLLAGNENPEWHWSVCFINLAFAIELGQKGYIRAQGAKRSEQLKLRHNLTAGFAATCRWGYNPSSTAFKLFVDQISPSIEDMSMRYLEGDKVDLIKLEYAIRIVQGHLQDLLMQSGIKVAGRLT